MSRVLKVGVLLVAVVSVHQVTAGADGARMPSSSSSAPAMRSPEERAVEFFNSGMSHRDKGIKHEEKAETASGSERQKGEANARKEFEKALKDFKNAISNDPKLFQAYNGLGYAYRKMGDFNNALQNYDRALAMQPGFTDAIEYRAEAYLSLNRLDDAKAAYLSLFAGDRPRADLLMGAMQRWVQQRTADPRGLDPAVVSAFETWVRERDEMARQTKLMALSGSPRSW